MHEDNGYHVIDTADDFIGWEVISVETWNPMSVRLHMRRLHEPMLPVHLTPEEKQAALLDHYRKNPREPIGEYLLAYCDSDLYSQWLERMRPR